VIRNESRDIGLVVHDENAMWGGCCRLIRMSRPEVARATLIPHFERTMRLLCSLLLDSKVL